MSEIIKSAFGVDLGVVSKADDDPYASHGRTATAAIFGGFHGLVAGKKGKKTRATANETLGTIGGSVAGGYAGRKFGGGNPRVAAVTGAAGSAAGAIAGLRRNQRKGYLKPIKSKGGS